jgi:hypothetical protein
MIGGALFVGFAEWYAYSHYFGPQVKTLDTQPGYKGPLVGEPPKVELPDMAQPQDRQPAGAPEAYGSNGVSDASAKRV